MALAVVVFVGLARGSDMAQREDKIQALAEPVRPLEQPSEAWLPGETEPLEVPPPQVPDSSLSVGGALRLNYGWRDYGEQDRDKVRACATALLINPPTRLQQVAESWQHTLKL